MDKKLPDHIFFRLRRKLGQRYKRHNNIGFKEVMNMETEFNNNYYFGIFERYTDAEEFYFTYDCITDTMSSYKISY